MRQEMLASMVMLGMQRIVIDSGKINAAMRFHIDTRSAAKADEGSRFELQNKINAEAHGGIGIWGKRLGREHHRLCLHPEDPDD